VDRDFGSWPLKGYQTIFKEMFAHRGSFLLLLLPPNIQPSNGATQIGKVYPELKGK
jgi:hypothetical protein